MPSRKCVQLQDVNVGPNTAFGGKGRKRPCKVQLTHATADIALPPRLDRRHLLLKGFGLALHLLDEAVVLGACRGRPSFPRRLRNVILRNGSS